MQYGYYNLEEIFREPLQQPIPELGGLLAAKVVATAVCVGGGLVGAHKGVRSGWG